MNTPETFKGKYYKVDVVMKTGFQYSFTSIGIKLKEVLQFTNGLYWTESTKHQEITEDEYTNINNGEIVCDKKTDKRKRRK